MKHAPRKTNKDQTRGGGTAIITKTEINVTVTESTLNTKFKQFEYMDCTLRTSGQCLRLLILYRPPPTIQNGLKVVKFWKEWKNLLNQCAISNDNVLLAGDLNFHLDQDHPDTTFFNGSLDEFGFIQHVEEPTHAKGHTLDVLISKANKDLISSITVKDPEFCNKQGHLLRDHFAILANLTIKRPEKLKQSVTFRPYKTIILENFQKDILESNLSNQVYTEHLTVDRLVDLYNVTLVNLLNKHAPLKTKTVCTKHKAPWFNKHLFNMKRERRQAERLWRRTGLLTHRQLYRSKCKMYDKLTRDTRKQYTSNIIKDCGTDQRKLFREADRLLGRTKSLNLPKHDSPKKLANRFADFFSEKIKNIKTDLIREQAETSNTEQCQETNDPTIDVNVKAVLSFFENATEEEVAEIIQRSQSKHCSLDPIPTWFLKQNLQQLCPIITNIINKSLENGDIPISLKTAIVKPLLKENNLDENDLANFRPVSNLPFISKTLERIVNKRLDQYLNINNLLDEGQTAYSKHNSTETALLSVQNHILVNMDEGRATVLVMLDLSAAYDTVDHKGFIERLEKDYGLTDTALSWMKSYVEGRQFQVSIAGKTSNTKSLDCGVPQGAVLGGKCFNMYTAPIGDITKHNSVERKGFADDNQAFVSFTIGDEEDMERAFLNLQTCLDELDQWLLNNFLKLNQDKTKLIFFAPKQKLHFFKDYVLHFGRYTI